MKEGINPAEDIKLHTEQAMHEPIDYAEEVAKLEQKVANRELLIERMLVYLRSREAGAFVATVEKHLEMLAEVEGGKQVHVKDTITLEAGAP